MTCLNGGDFNTATGMVMDGDCVGSCRCVGGWSGDSCETCGLQCGAHGSPLADGSCTTCQCADGWTGGHCQCTFARLSIPLDMDWAAAHLHNDTRARARFDAALAADLEAAARSSDPTTSAQASVESVQFGPGASDVLAQVKFGPRCSDVAAISFGATAASAMAVSRDSLVLGTGEDGTGESQTNKTQHAAAHLTVTVPPRDCLLTFVVCLFVFSLLCSALLSVYSLLLPLFADTDSALWHGQVTQHLSTSRVATASDPAGGSSLPQPVAGMDCFQQVCTSTSSSGGGGSGSGSSSSALSLRIIIIISVVGGVLVLALLLGALLVRKRVVARRLAAYETQARMQTSLQGQKQQREMTRV